MKISAAKCLAPVLGSLIIIFNACSPLRQQPPPIRMPPAETLHFTEDEQIAGEIMAYLIEVVLGRAGAPKNRQAWSTRGLGLPLDFNLVSRRMFGPVPLRAELMVLDTNILGLSRVLYHYDHRLNLFKGTRDPASLYPCSELMAIRLLLLKKIHLNEKVSIAAMTRHAALFAPGSRDAVGAELASMGLTGTEFRFLKDIFQSEPAFLRYMRHPFIVSTLRKIGVAEPDAFTLSADLAATYDRLSGQSGGKTENNTVTVAIVPAMTTRSDFLFPDGSDRPSDDDPQLLEKIRAAIKDELNRRKKIHPADGRLVFFTPDRPVTIYPENADRVIGQLCPAADFTIILLGKNVYRAIFIDADMDIYPHKKWIYLDIDDVRYQQINSDIESVVTAILPAIVARSQPSPTS